VTVTAFGWAAFHPHSWEWFLQGHSHPKHITELAFAIETNRQGKGLGKETAEFLTDWNIKFFE